DEDAGQLSLESEQDPLVPDGRRGRHVERALDRLVAIPVVRELLDVVPGDLRHRHGHIIPPLAGGNESRSYPPPGGQSDVNTPRAASPGPRPRSRESGRNPGRW